MSNNVIGIDLGTSNIKIFNKASGEIINEKNVIAIANKTELYAYGDHAFEMHEKAPSRIQVSFPMFNGVVADYKNMQILLAEFLKRMMKSKIKGANYIIAIPTDITEVDKKTFQDVVKGSNIKAKTVMVAEKPVADAVGMGLDVRHAIGIMIVDIGADTTEISILSLGGIVISRLLKLGGNKFDESIINVIKKKYNLVIGKKTAMNLKKELGSAIPTEKTTMKAVGLDIVTGLPAQMEIESGLIHEALSENIKTIIDSIKIILERTPPELAVDIVQSGIFVTGGSSQLNNMDKLITQVTNLKVNTCEYPSETVVRGLMKIVSEEELKPLLYTMKFKTYS